MAPFTAHWIQPSHPDIQEVIFTSTSATEFSTKSISLIDLPPFAVYARLAFPPCTPAPTATYATIQMGKTSHLSLNSDLVYINHSCEPSVIFDTSSLHILAGPRGLKTGQELTFFYPSTEWCMAQGFTCICSSPGCKGYISGARDMSASSLIGHFLNAHILTLLQERDGLGVVDKGVVGEGVIVGFKKGSQMNGNAESNGVFTHAKTIDPVTTALESSVQQARALVSSTQEALDPYKTRHPSAYSDSDGDGSAAQKGAVSQNGVGSRGLGGEMGGDTL